MTRSGLAFAIAAMTSSNWLTSPRITRTCLPYSEKFAVCGLMSMQTISSPRLASSGTRRRPIKPVPPRIRIDMGSSPVKCAQGSLVPREGFRQRRVGQSPLQRGAVPVREIGGSLVGALQKVEKRGGGVGRLAHRLIRQDEFADFLAVIR